MECRSGIKTVVQFSCDAKSVHEPAYTLAQDTQEHRSAHGEKRLSRACLYD